MAKLEQLLSHLLLLAANLLGGYTLFMLVMDSFNG